MKEETRYWIRIKFNGCWFDSFSMLNEKQAEEFEQQLKQDYPTTDWIFCSTDNDKHTR